jgi:excisionase family DNA binding protein
MQTMEQMLEAIVERVVRRVVPELLAAQAGAAAPEVLTVDQAAALAKVHHSTIREWIKDGSLPACRPNRRSLRIKREDLLARLARQAVVKPRGVDVDSFVASVLGRKSA